MTNILQALVNIKNYGSNSLGNILVVNASGKKPRVNSEGDELDAYVKDALCNSFKIENSDNKMKSYRKVLSHLGSQNNPPDIMIRRGDAIEVKKISGLGSHIALNSSYPKQKLKVNDRMITQECRDCEDWKIKDLIYCVGNIENRSIKVLIFVYGDCYSASNETYSKIKDSMIKGIGEIDVKLSKTNEIARLNKIDPLNITDFRVRGLWQMKTPLRVFSKYIKIIPKKKMVVYCIMKENKFNTFPKKDVERIEKNLEVKNIKISNPDNPSKNIDAKLISFSI